MERTGVPEALELAEDLRVADQTQHEAGLLLYKKANEFQRSLKPGPDAMNLWPLMSLFGDQRTFRGQTPSRVRPSEILRCLMSTSMQEVEG
jgi:hypothetical protein